jgi:hypothetical protein
MKCARCSQDRETADSESRQGGESATCGGGIEGQGGVHFLPAEQHLELPSMDR